MARKFDLQYAIQNSEYMYAKEKESLVCFVGFSGQLQYYFIIYPIYMMMQISKFDVVIVRSGGRIESSGLSNFSNITIKSKL